MRQLSFLITAAIFSSSALSHAAETDTIAGKTLGDVMVMGQRHKAGVNAVDADFMLRHDKERLTDAIDMLPGITVRDAGARNEGSFYLRGFDQRRVPVFLDGIPVYVPYEGEMDIRRFQTAALAKVSVAKTMPSLLLGGNAMGGAINLVTAEPSHLLEVGVNGSTLWDVGARLGTRHSKWFSSASFSLLKRDYVRLPHSFKPIEGLQEGRHLVNSDTRDLSFNFKAGYTPNSTDSYVVSYMMIRADKGVPVYLGKAGKPRYWRYPRWDKDEVAFHSSTKLWRGSLETRLFYDHYFNRLRSYDDISCTTQDRKSSFTSVYNDFSVGGYAGYGINLAKNDLLRFGANFKRDVHRAHDEGEPQARMADNLYSVAAENTLDLTKTLQINAAIGLFGRKGTSAEKYEGPADAPNNGIVDYPLTSNLDLNYQASAKWKFMPSHSATLSFARTSRFPTLAERYSFKMGKAIPNPDLTTEHAYNLDLTVNGRYGDLSWSVSGYYSWLTNCIMEITGVDPENPTIWQLQNKGRAQFRGFEVALKYELFRQITLTGNYSYIDRINKTDRSVRFTDVPRSKGIVAVDWKSTFGLGFEADMVAYSSALSASDGSLKVPGFGIVNLGVSYKFWHDRFTVAAGVRNVTDKLYYYTEGYPQPGRTFFGSLRFDFATDFAR